MKQSLLGLCGHRDFWRQTLAELPGRASKGDREIPAGCRRIGGDRKAIPSGKLSDAKVIEILRQVVAEIPWGQNLLILNKLNDPAARLYYLRATARFGWTRNVLLNQIKAGAYERSVAEKKSHNFDLVLPDHLAEQADEMLKSSYNLEFLGLRRAVGSGDSRIA